MRHRRTRGCRGGTVGRGPVITAGETCMWCRWYDGVYERRQRWRRGQKRQRENQECRGRRRVGRGQQTGLYTPPRYYIPT